MLSIYGVNDKLAFLDVLHLPQVSMWASALLSFLGVGGVKAAEEYSELV
jgi:hypothetical protein